MFFRFFNKNILSPIDLNLITYLNNIDIKFSARLHELEENLQKIQIKREIKGIWSSVFCFTNVRLNSKYRKLRD